MAVRGKRVCYLHGGAPGSGAPKGNQNRRVHGLDSRQFRHGTGLRRAKASGGAQDGALPFDGAQGKLSAQGTAGALRGPQDGADTPGVLYRAQELLTVEGLSEEIATFRVLLRDAVEDKRDLTTIARGMEVLAKLARAQYAMSPRSRDNLSAAIAVTLERLGDQLGLKEFIEDAGGAKDEPRVE